MEPNLFRYIWANTRREQLVIVLIIAISMIPYYLAFDLPKQIVNGPLQGTGFETPEATQLFLPISFDLPYLGTVELFEGIAMERLPLLWSLSLTFLALVVVNNLFKYMINTRKGRMGERLLRRVRYQLVDRILRFPAGRFKRMKAGEVSSMVKDEIEPIGGFAGDAFTQPVLLGGQALTAMVFIFVQHFWLGLVALGMAGIQVAIIPRMRRRLILLGRQRQLTARELAGRVSEVVDNIQTIHSSDTTNWERADLIARLGRIYRIRFDIYQWKFLVKFLNNFLSQMTPFLFYAIGGYLTIEGALDVGQLVAVINAYKELPGPLKELIDWDLARQDMQVKYEQVVDQFASDQLIEPARQEMNAEVVADSFDPLQLQELTVTSDLGEHLIEDVTLRFVPGEAVIVTGGSGDGASVLGEALTGVVVPARGRMTIGGLDLQQTPEWVNGRVIGYAAPSPTLFSGSVLDNLTYALHRRPGRVPADEPAAARARRDWHRTEALRAGNPLLPHDVDWIDYDSVQPRGTGQDLMAPIHTILDVVELRGDVFGLGMRSRASEDQAEALAPYVLALRQALRAELQALDLKNLVLPFEPNQYNAAATVGENLFFGVMANADRATAIITSSPAIRMVLSQTGLDADLFALGWNFAKATVDLFADVEDMPEMMQSLTYMSSEDLTEFGLILERTLPGGMGQASLSDQLRLIQLAATYVEPSYRFGLLEDNLRHRIVAARRLMAGQMPEDLRDLFQPYDANHFMKGATILENMIFGKVNRRFGRAEERVEEVVRQIVREHVTHEPALRDGLMALGLAVDVGPGGRRLTLLQRQKLALARVLIRRSSYYVFNEPLAGVDQKLQKHMAAKILAFLKGLPKPPGVIWITANPGLAGSFDRVVAIERGHVIDGDGPRSEKAVRS